MCPFHYITLFSVYQIWEGGRNLTRVKQFDKGEIKNTIGNMENKICAFLEEKISESKKQDEENVKKITADYTASIEEYEKNCEKLNQAAAEKKEADYQAACQAFEQANNVESYEEARRRFAVLGAYKDSEAKAEECINTVNKLGKQRKKKRTIIGSGIAVVIVAVALLMDPVIIPNYRYNKAQKLLDSGDKASAAIMFGKAKGYKDAKERSFFLWDEVAQRDTVSCVVGNTVGLKSDGTVVAVGNNDDGQCNVGDWRDIVAVSAGRYHTVGLKSDGTVVAVGSNEYGQCNVDDWTNIVAISTGYSLHTVGLKSDGTVVAVGCNDRGQCNVSNLKNIVDVNAGGASTIGVKSDGTVVYLGERMEFDSWKMENWKHIKDISVGDDHVVGLLGNGRAVTSVDDEFWMNNVGRMNGMVAISAGYNGKTIGLKSDGTVMIAGKEMIIGRPYDITDLTDVVAASYGYDLVCLKSDGTVVRVEHEEDQDIIETILTGIKLPNKYNRVQ